MKRVLLVDDQVDVQSMIADLLRNHSLKVDACANGVQACESVKKNKYDLIVSDLIMPKEDGFSFLYKVRNVFHGLATTPIIVITGGSNSMDFSLGLDELMKYENISLLKKPFGKDDFIDCVCKSLGTSMEDYFQSIEAEISAEGHVN